MARDGLYEALAEALSRPSKGYQALETAFSGVRGTAEGLNAYDDRQEMLRKRLAQQQTLKQALEGRTIPGTEPIESVTMENLPSVSGLNKWRPETGLSDLEKEAFRDARQDKALAAAEKRNAAMLAMAGQRLGLQKQAKEEKREKANLLELDRSKGIIRTIDSALSKVGPLTTGVAGAILKNVPATSAKNLNETLLTVKANVGFEELQRMRQSSPTGGALGQVSDAENRLLQATRGSLDQAQSTDQVVKNLAEMRKHYSNVILAIEGQTGDPEADEAIAKIIASDISEQEKRARIQGIRGTAGL